MRCWGRRSADIRPWPVWKAARVKAFRCRVCDQPAPLRELRLRLLRHRGSGSPARSARSSRSTRRAATSTRHGAGGSCAATSTLSGCTWLAPSEGGQCFACDLTRTRPNDDDAAGLANFPAAERAKRHLVVELDTLGFPVVGKHEDPENGLAFDLLEQHRARTS